VTALAPPLTSSICAGSSPAGAFTLRALFKISTAVRADSVNVRLLSSSASQKRVSSDWCFFFSLAVARFFRLAFLFRPLNGTFLALGVSSSAFQEHASCHCAHSFFPLQPPNGRVQPRRECDVTPSIEDAW